MQDNILNGRGIIVGWQEDAGNLINIFDYSGKLLGYYIKDTKQTMSVSGAVISNNGNALTSLILDWRN